MSDALPALVCGLINSVIAPRGNPPPIVPQEKVSLVIKRVASCSDG